MAENKHKIGWIGVGRMGYPMAERLIKAGYDVAIWNRTRAKAEPLAKSGGKVVANLADLKTVDVLLPRVAASRRKFSSTARPSRSRSQPQFVNASKASAAISSPRR